MTTYTNFFGLSKAPFSALAAGSDVFVAPQVATAMAGIKKALATEDAIIAVSGPVGAGKTTIARRALGAAAEFHIIVTIGRIQFGHDEVLELLLAGLGVKQLPKSTVHRFATFRRVLQQYAEQKTRVFILIEDATRVGFDALSELEAVTAADAGVSGGANLILLGDESLNDLLRETRMARIKQRIRSRQQIVAQDEGELRGYLKHCFRLAGKEFDEIFSDDCVASLLRLSDGLPRVVNNLVAAALAAAAEQGQSQIDAAFIERIASEEFGLTSEHRVEDIEAVIEQASEPVAVVVPDLVAEPEPESEPEPEPEPEEDIPELIQDTLPDLQILAPQLLPDENFEAELQALPEPPPAPAPIPELTIEPVAIAAPAPEPEPEPAPAPATTEEPIHEPTEFELPILTGVFPIAEEAQPEPEPEPEPAVISTEPVESAENAEEVPAWERDPTLAQLRPDLDALDRAMAVAQGKDDTESLSVAAEHIAREQAAAAKAALEKDIPEIVPEITLDKQIEAKIEEATEALKQTQIDATADLNDESDSESESESESNTAHELPAGIVAPPADMAEETPSPTIALDTPSPDSEKADQELEKIASDLAKAKTIEDVDDQLAETLFGEEFSMIAAQVAANAPSIMAETEVATGTPAGETAENVALSLEEDPVDDSAEAQDDEMDTSSSQRLQALRNLNDVPPPPGAPSNPETSETIVMSGGGVELPPAVNSESVESIEDQINVSMTQNLKALSIDHLPRQFDVDDDDTVEKTGFFGLFKRK